jgi:hypothetical protein
MLGPLHNVKIQLSGIIFRVARSYCFIAFTSLTKIFGCFSFDSRIEIKDVRWMDIAISDGLLTLHPFTSYTAVST